MRTPTVHTLKAFADYDSVTSLRAGLGGRRDIGPILPRITKDGRRLMPGDAGYDEVAAEEGLGKWS
jgi:hypothetical protein